MAQVPFHPGSAQAQMVFRQAAAALQTGQMGLKMGRMAQKTHPPQSPAAGCRQGAGGQAAGPAIVLRHPNRIVQTAQQSLPAGIITG